MAALTSTTRPQVQDTDTTLGAPDEAELVRLAGAGAARAGRVRGSVPIGLPTTTCPTWSCV